MGLLLVDIAWVKEVPDFVDLTEDLTGFKKKVRSCS